MKRMFIIISVFSLSAFSACFSSAGFGPVGALYQSTTIGIHAEGEDPLNASSTGEACAASYLGWIATGEAGVMEAARNGGITTVKTIDFTTYSILGVYSELCTVVRGD